MDNPGKLVTYGTQDEEKQSKNTTQHNTVQNNTGSFIQASLINVNELEKNVISSFINIVNNLCLSNTVNNFFRQLVSSWETVQ